MTISTIFADRDDVAVGGRRDNQTNRKRGGVLPLLALVWDGALLGNARNRRVAVLDPWILADDDRTCLSDASASRKISDRTGGHRRWTEYKGNDIFFMPSARSNDFLTTKNKKYTDILIYVLYIKQ